MDAQPPILDVRDLLKVRSQGGAVFRLHVPEMLVRHGEFIAVVGESGCGKSTLLDMLGLILRPTTAERFSLHLPGQERAMDVASANPSQQALLRRNYLGYVLQTGGLLPYLKVRDNIQLTSRLSGRIRNAQVLHNLCTTLRISDQLEKFPSHLSGGQRQRVAIARALIHQPTLVLADEPTAAVDRVTARDIRDTFRGLTREQKTTVLMVTHDLELVKAVADRQFTFRTRRDPDGTVQSECFESV
jgi:putative ABC transport system ATP-binding protein